MLTSSYPRHAGDGSGSFVASLARTLVELGKSVTVVAPWDEALAPMDQAGVEVHRFRYAPQDAWHVAGHGRSLRADRGMRLLAPMLMPAYVASALKMVRRLHQAEPFDLLHGHWAVPSAPVAARLADLTGKPLVVSLHGSDVYVIEHNPVYAAAARYAFRRASAVLACSQDLRRRALRVGLAEGKSRVVPYGVDAERFGSGDGARLRRRLHIPAEAPVIGAMGRLVYKKGFRYLIEALPALLRRFPELYCVIGGEGDLQADLRQAVETLGIDERCLLPGNIPWEWAADYYAACDLVVVPSIVDQTGNVDGLPNVLLESMASGCAVVASSVAGIPDTVTHGVTGILVPPGDPAAIAEACARLLSDPALRQTLGRNAREQMLRMHSWQAVAESHLQVYEAACHA